MLPKWKQLMSKTFLQSIYHVMLVVGKKLIEQHIRFCETIFNCKNACLRPDD